MFSKKKKLFEMDPKTLQLDSLLHLQASLLAKLMLVTKELHDRFEALALASQELGEEPPADFTKEAKRMNGLYMLLDNVLAQQVGKAPIPS